ncbi:RTA1 like protein-domain-containing protein [Stachybotrys elegans]|uniref:RTA1 like protein-domain-containing protein n=1 Tax=Stachybotrys elegans TaxID=80388 RepID=A0A8K0SX66_9HYPO|nr:RTA1 like protein-domain-containing protein [Stachybotrys elegans]
MSESEMPGQLPHGLISFGPDANCTLELCPIEASVYQYRPSLPANIIFLVLFGLAVIVHGYLGFRWRSYLYMVLMQLGCIMGMVGYAGRIMMWVNPFSFIGFMLQVVFITSAPVFYTAAIYVTLARAINFFGPELARFDPKWLIWVFVPFDLVCLGLQAAGGALSTTSSGASQIGIDVAMAGLILQVIVLFFFCVLLGDYLVRYSRAGGVTSGTRMKLFFGFLSLAVVLIFIRCVFRAYELSQGYRGSELITDEPLFIGLEAVLVVLSAFSLAIGHPGLVFNKTTSPPGNVMEDGLATETEQKNRGSSST